MKPTKLSEERTMRRRRCSRPTDKSSQHLSDGGNSRGVKAVAAFPASVNYLFLSTAHSLHVGVDPVSKTRYISGHDKTNAEWGGGVNVCQCVQQDPAALTHSMPSQILSALNTHTHTRACEYLQVCALSCTQTHLHTLQSSLMN